jgi:hypothetical protein
MQVNEKLQRAVYSGLGILSTQPVFDSSFVLSSAYLLMPAKKATCSCCCCCR